MNYTEKDFFSVVDYVVFILILVISTIIGVYYGYKGRKKCTNEEYLMGGRNLGVFPVAMCIIHSFISAITLLGNPTEVYLYGTQYWMICLAFFLVVPTTAYLYLPVYYNLKLTSAYEYLELRFNRTVRTIGSFCFWIHMILYMPIVLYAPALALAEVTGLNFWFSVLSVGLVCTFYTSIGGMKATVYNDLFQSLMMFASLITIIVKGSYDMGGFSKVWNKCEEGGRIEFFNFNVDPTVRHTFWTLVIGGYLMWMGNFAADQSMVQRYLTLSTLRKAEHCLWVSLPALCALIITSCIGGLLVYAYYWDCDPFETNILKKSRPDQLFPRYVMETFRGYPGVPGLFVAGVFSGSLSTVSSGVNALAAVTIEDIVKVYISNNLSQETATRITKCFSLFYGLISIVLVLVAKKLGGVLQAANTVHGVMAGPMLGLVTMGMFFPWINSLGASSGVAFGLILALWIGFGSMLNPPFYPQKPMSYSNCTELYYNATGIRLNDTSYVYATPMPGQLDVLSPYKMSYLWITAVGLIGTLAVGNVVSLLSGRTTSVDIDDKLFSPLVHWLRRHCCPRKANKIPSENSDEVGLQKSSSTDKEFSDSKLALSGTDDSD